MIAGSYADALYDSEKIICKQSNTTSLSPFFGPDCLLTEDVDQSKWTIFGRLLFCESRQ